MSTPRPTPAPQPPVDPCDKLVADIEEAAATGFTPNAARKASLESRIAGCPDATFSAAAEAWLTTHSIAH